MPRKNQEEFTSISIRKIELKKLEKYKIHPNQPMWEIIKKFINNAVKSDQDKTQKELKEDNNRNIETSDAFNNFNDKEVKHGNKKNIR